MSDSFDVIVIGAGPAGYVAAIRCAQLGLKTACIDKRMELGGTCLNVGCIPSKTLLHSSHLFELMKKDSSKLGIKIEGLSPDLLTMMKRKKDVLSSLNEGIKGLFKKNKITHFIGQASFTSENSILVNQGPTSQALSAKYFIIATGSEPVPLPFLPFDERRVLSSTGALSLEKIPQKLVVIGAGVIGVELGSVYSRLGTEVVFVEFLDKVCPMFDSSISKTFQEILQKQGMKFHLSSKVTSVEINDKDVLVKASTNTGEQFEISSDAVLVSIGRRPFTEGLSLDKAKVTLTERKQVIVDGQFRTSNPNIFAIGDIIDGPMLAHKASEEGVCVAEIIAGQNPHIDYFSIPNVIYTHPEVAAVGFTEQQAIENGFSINVGTYFFKANSRAKCSMEEEGFVKVVADQKTDKLLGLHILGAHASEMIALGTLALEKRLTCLELANSCFSHPTLSEAIKEAAMSVHKKAIHK